MRRFIIFALLISTTTLKAQMPLTGGSLYNNYPTYLDGNLYRGDSISTKKWSINRFSSLMTGFTFYNGGSASFLSVPIGLQLNRRLTNNLFAFARVSAAPTYMNFGRSFTAGDFGKGDAQNAYWKPGNLGLNPRAEVGFQYVNDERTFSISGSIGVQRSTYPLMPYNQVNPSRSNQYIPSAR